MAKQIMADIDFERELWTAANEPRGAVAENQYKDFVLSLLFLKHLSERSEMRREELTELVHQPESHYYTIDPTEIDYILDDPDEYKAKNVFMIPQEATWIYLQQNAEQDDIKIRVDKAFTIIDDILADTDPNLKGILPPIFVRSGYYLFQAGRILSRKSAISWVLRLSKRSFTSFGNLAQSAPPEKPSISWIWC